MKRHYLTLKATYLPGWGLYEGIRELVQNARDAEIQDDAPMKVEFVYRQRNKAPIGTVIISNDGTVIPKDAFLIGHTSKTARQDLIGKFGEGFKFGILALLRIPGIEIKIRNGNESWNPLICTHKDYESEVLAFDVAEGNKWENRVQIEIIGVSAEDWGKIQEKFLFITPPHPSSVIKVYGGRVLLSPQHAGMLFVKGMFVCKDEKFFYGYDIDEADIDRDRRMLSNTSEVTGRLLSSAMAEGKLTEKVYELLHQGSVEASGILSYTLDEKARTAIVEAFHQQYGESAIPVDSSDQITELGHLGVRGVRLPWNLQSIICSSVGTARENLAKLKMNVKHNYLPSELLESEQAVLRKAQLVLRNVLSECNFGADIADNISVVDFNDSSVVGTYLASDKSIRVARQQLNKFSSTLRTLIGEAAHQAGPSGSKQHEMALGDLMEAAFNILTEE